MILMALYSQQRTYFFSLTAMKELLVEVFASM